jgi:hypothetical protein
MQKSTKVLLGAASLWPIVYMFLFIGFFFLAVLFGPGPAEPGSGTQPAWALFIGVHLLTMLLILALTVFYIINIFRNDRVEKDKKALWAIVIFMGNAIAMPIYWYLYIWKEAGVGGASPPGKLNSGSTTSWTNDVNAAREQQREYVPPPQPPNWRE